MLTNKERDEAVRDASNWLQELSEQTSDAIMHRGPLDYDYDLDDAHDVHKTVMEIGAIARRAFEDIKLRLDEIETLVIEQETEARRGPSDPNAEHSTYRVVRGHVA